MTQKFLTGINNNNQRLINLADGSSATDAVTLQQLQAMVRGLSWKDEVRVATTASGTLATAYENGDTIDGITLATGDRILLKDQSSGQENGIYTVNASGAPTRATDADSTTELENATVFVMSGTVNADKAFTQTATITTVNTTVQTWVQFGGGTTYTADGSGIELSSTTFSLELDGTTLSKSASGLRIGSGAAGAGLVEASGVLAVGAGTGITVNADDVQVNTSVVSRKYAANCVVTTDPQTFPHSLGTADLNVDIYESGVKVFPDISVDSTNITVTWGSAPTAAQYRVVAKG